MQEVEAICDRVIIINKGEIVLDKKLSELQTVALQQIPNVTKVENPGGYFIYNIYFSSEKDMRSSVFDFAHDNGLKILQLHQKNTNLEKLFVDLTAHQK